MKKFYLFAAVASMSVLSARAEVTITVSDVNDGCQLMGENMTLNGKYVVGTNYSTFAPCVWDVENNVYYDFVNAEEGSTFHAGSNNGLFVGENGDYAACATLDGELQTLYYNVGEEIYNEELDFWYSTGDAGSSAYAVTADGETIFGYYFDQSYYTTPCYWRNGERFDLPLPTFEETGFGFNGGEVRWCTPDGKVLLGFLMDDYGTWPACVWRMNEDGRYECDPVCKDFYEADYGFGKPYMLFCPYGLSENGEWVSISLQEEFDAFNWAPQTPVQMARLNLNSGELQILGEEVDQATIAGCIANDGSMLFIANALMGMVGREAYYWAAGTQNSIALEELTGELDEMADLLGNTPCFISADGKTIQGFGLNANADIFSYIITMADAVSLNKLAAEQGMQICNLQGEQLSEVSAPGIYVINGKKVLVK